MGKYYPEPNITQAVDVLKYVDAVSNGAASLLWMVVANIILYILFKRKIYTTSNALSASLLLTTVLASFLWALGQLPGRYLVTWLLLGVAATLWSVIEGK